MISIWGRRMTLPNKLLNVVGIFLSVLDFEDKGVDDQAGLNPCQGARVIIGVIDLLPKSVERAETTLEVTHGMLGLYSYLEMINRLRENHIDQRCTIHWKDGN